MVVFVVRKEVVHPPGLLPQDKQLLVFVDHAEPGVEVVIRGSEFLLNEFQTCVQAPFFETFRGIEEELGPLAMIMVDGMTYRVAGQFGRTEDPPTVFVSDITVSPA